MAEAEIRIALAGNPNCGKTTTFNHLTGSNQYVGNWPGVTVEKKEGRLKGHKEVIIQDLPGIYSLSPYTLEEVVSRNYLIKDRPDAIINLVDASNLERNLYLTTQLCEVGLPMVLAFNMMDLADKNGIQIDMEGIGNSFGCEVAPVTAVRGKGTIEAAEVAIRLARSGEAQKPVHEFSESVEKALQIIASVVAGYCEAHLIRWYAIKVFERDREVLQEFTFTTEEQELIDNTIVSLEEAMDDDSESIITNERYDYIAAVMKKCVVRQKTGEMSTSDKIDQLVTNRWLALPIFVGIMTLVYVLAVTTVGGWMTDWVNDVLFGKWVPSALGGLLESIGTAAWLQGLVMDGIVAGVGAVLGFLPQMAVLFLCLTFLEDCGYMSRIAFIMDRVFRRFGLSGKSFIPILIGTGCGVPGIMASRTIENEKDRRMTVMVTTFIPCSAKMPIIGMIAGALFGGAWWVAPSAYFLGIGAIVFSGIVLKKTKVFAGDPAPFVMELPAYHLPRVIGVCRSTWDRTWSFVKRAGTVILISSVAIWFLMSFSWTLEMVDQNESILASIGGAISWIFNPLGWGEDWRHAVAAIQGLVAKENVVGTFGVLYSGLEEVSDLGEEVWAPIAATFTGASAYSFLVFNLLCAPCFAAIGAIRREMGSAQWTWATIGYQTGLAYAASLIVYQLGSFLFEGAHFGIGQIIALILVAFGIWMLFRKGSKPSGDSISAVQANA